MNYCAACYPHKIRSHCGIYFGALIDLLMGAFLSYHGKPQLPRGPRWFSVMHFWYQIMELFGLIKFTDHFEQKDHYPRSWAPIVEAQARGILISSAVVLGKVSSYYRVKFGTKYFYYDAVPSRFLNFHLDDKDFVKMKLLRNAFPATEGGVFWSLVRAARFGAKLGFPLVVKPARGTHAFHVTAPVQNKEELQRALALAKQYGPRVIVERFQQGELYRVSVINGTHVYVARREAPNVVGDGAHTIRELIEIKNSDPRRGDTGQKDTTLHKIPTSGTTDKALEHAGLTYDYVPKKNEKIILHSKASIGSGGDVYEETDKLHPLNREMFRRATRLFGVDLVGFDIIAEDLSRPYTEQSCGILEANSLPMIDFHHYPEYGAPQHVAAALWDEILADARVRYVYPVRVHRSVVTRMLWHFLDVFVPMVRGMLLELKLVPARGRQQFSVGKLREDIEPEQVIAHLKMNGYEVVRPAWIDKGEITGLRKLLDHERQCHVRFFADGEVRAHVEFAPEARPFAHLLEQGFQAAHEVVHALLHQFLAPTLSSRAERSAAEGSRPHS